MAKLANIARSLPDSFWFEFKKLYPAAARHMQEFYTKTSGDVSTFAEGSFEIPGFIEIRAFQHGDLWGIVDCNPSGGWIGEWRDSYEAICQFAQERYKRDYI